MLVVAGQRGIAVALESGFLLGALCLVGDAFLFAVYSTLVRGLRTRYSALQVTAGTTVAGALGLCLLAGVGEDWGSLLQLSAAQWGAILYLALGCSVLAYLAYNRALAEVEASRAAAWLYLEPVVAVALGALLLDEEVAVQTLVGGAIIVAALVVAGRT